MQGVRDQRQVAGGHSRIVESPRTVSYPKHGTHQVVLLGALQEQSFVPFVAGEDHLHPLMGFQADGPEHRPSPIQHFEHFVSLELNADGRAVCLGTVPLHG